MAFLNAILCRVLLRVELCPAFLAGEGFEELRGPLTET